MSVTSSVGIFSGINSSQIIDQLMAIEAQPKTAIQKRIANFQLQQSAFLDFNSQLNNIKSMLAGFRTDNLFKLASATSSDDTVVKATASNGAAAGTYQILVDRLVSSQQMLSRGFGDKDTSGLGITQLTVESSKGRLDHDVALSDLKGGAGIARGKIVLTDSANKSATVDLSKAGSIGEVVDLINANGAAAVTASVLDDKLVITDNAGGGASFKVSNATGSTTATSLGIDGAASGGKITGSSLMSLSTSTTLASLNDGNGVYVKPHSSIADADMKLTVTVGGVAKDVEVNIGDVYEMVDSKLTKTKSAPTTVGGVLDRINSALTAAGATTVSASIGTDGKRLSIVDSANNPITVVEDGSAGAAAALGILGSAAGGSLQGKRVLSGLSTTLAKSINGGAGLGGDGTLTMQARDGSLFSVSLSSDASLAEIAKAIQDASGTVGSSPKLSVGLNARGTGLLITDNTGGTGKLIITGTTGSDTAASLGISTGAAGVSASTVTGSNLQRKYISSATSLASMNSGKGIGAGKFTITDATGSSSTINVDTTMTSVGDLLDQINRSGLKITASINSNGDGILISDTSSPAGGSKIKIADSTGNVAKTLNLAGEAADASTSNKIDGTFERVVKFDATDTLTQVVSKLNSAGAGAIASIINDGSGSTPYRINISATNSGEVGRVIIDSGAFDMGLTTTQQGQDARAFFGSSDPSKALLISSSTNTLDGAINGVKLDLGKTSDTAAQVTVAKDAAGIEAKIDDFVTAFNGLVGRIGTQTAYDQTTNRSGILLGDGTTLSLRTSLYSTIQANPIGVTPRYSRLSEIGLSVGTGGAITFDKTKFANALTTDPDAVEQMLLARKQIDTSKITVADGVTVNNPNGTAQFSELGIFTQMEQLASRYVDSTSGILTGRNKSIDTTIKSLNDQSAALDVRIAAKRAILQKQFLAMEQTIGNLQQSSSSISQIGG